MFIIRHLVLLLLRTSSQLLRGPLLHSFHLQAAFKFKFYAIKRCVDSFSHRHHPLIRNAPCEYALNKFGLHFRHCHQRTKHCQCLQRKTSWRTVAVPRKANTTAATANLSSTRVRPPVTTAIAASSPDNHHVQAPRHPASKSEALSEILDLLDGPLSFFLTFFSWLIILVQLPKVAVRHRSSSTNFEAHSAQSQCSKTICHC